ncbi:pyruvate synthase [Desulfoscipio gibsoniae]|uniref:2-oxoacid:ferredoxin oxidoreductase, alpha subunit n=1 Tax=Desulfoscipio gibsoniae DSM 7213 TaxID=767817 RepID=R4KG58_9FIRM|nr:pyruvate synthase [Desulfoscipio gibsoniae]AGL00652.1 2-oxoacid:ferredoxin oxidoreductase, alpha subunit [Desulfoscipio gibsoniae DSM 7213]
MSQGHTRMLLNGNHAVAHGVKLARPMVVPVYPITPQTPIVEKISEFQLQGVMDADLMTMESEHSAMAACITASLTGVRVFTATASQGLMLMHEMLHYASGAQTPIVMCNVNRTIGSPWGFWPDQTDSLAQRDTGWIQYYCESAQESLDTILQAYWVAEKVLLPAMVMHEAFYVSHALETVDVPDQEIADTYLPPFSPYHRLDPEIGASWGNVVNQDMFYRHRQTLGQSMEKAIEVALEADMLWEKLTGRGYGVIEEHRCTDAEIIIATTGSMAGTAREAVDQLRDSGMPVGLLKVKLFRPFPVELVRRALDEIPRVIVLDRNFAPGTGGFLHQELKAALYGLKNGPVIYGYLTGVGGTNVPPDKIAGLVRESMEEEPVNSSVWKG